MSGSAVRATLVRTADPTFLASIPGMLRYNRSPSKREKPLRSGVATSCSPISRRNFMSTHRQLWMAALAVGFLVGLVGCGSSTKPSGAAGGDKKGGTATEPVAYTLKLKSHPDVGQSMTVIQKDNSDGTFSIK